MPARELDGVIHTLLKVPIMPLCTDFTDSMDLDWVVKSLESDCPGLNSRSTTS